MANVTWDSANKSAGVTLGTGNAASGTGSVTATSGQATGKYYFEYTLGPIVTALSNSVWFELGVAPNDIPVATTSGGGAYLLNTSATAVELLINGVVVGSAWTPASFAAGTVVGVAYDMDNQRIWFRVAGGSWNNSGTADPATPSTGASLAGLGTKGISLLPRAYINGTSNGITANFGDTAFSGAVPTGFTAGVPTGGVSNVLVSQEGIEVWETGVAAARVSQVGIETWEVGASAMRVSQLGVEIWRSVADAPVVLSTGPVVMMLS